MAPKVAMREADMIELYQLLGVYRAVYGERDAARAVMDDLEAQYKEKPDRRFGGIGEARNPRGAGRRRAYTEEDDARIWELYAGGGMPLREIAGKAGCSLGHVQDVIRRSRPGGMPA